MMKYLTATFLILQMLSKSDLRGAERAKPWWTRQSVESELESFQSVLKELGLKSPMKRVRKLADGDQDRVAAGVQQRSQSQIDYWRHVLLSDRSWGELLDLTVPSLQSVKTELEAGGATRFSMSVPTADTIIPTPFRSSSGRVDGIRSFILEVGHYYTGERAMAARR